MLQSRSLLKVRSEYGGLDDGARYHIISHLLLEMVISGKSMLATSMLGHETVETGNNNRGESFILNLLQKDRVFSAVHSLFVLLFFFMLKAILGFLNDHCSTTGMQSFFILAV